MADESIMTIENETPETVLRIYEIGYQILPTVAEDKLEGAVGEIRALIEQAGGTFIAEGAPTLMRLAYDMEKREGEKWASYDRGYFGWLKFEAPTTAARAIDDALKVNPSVLRHIVFQTVREDTRARIKLGTVREVKRPETAARTTVRREEEAAAPVSEADLEKALSDITTE